MRHQNLSSLVLAVLFAATGCSASTRLHSSTTPRGSNFASADPSWTPPEEWSFTTTENTPRRPTFVAEALPAPNRRDISRGQLHAAQ